MGSFEDKTDLPTFPYTFLCLHNDWVFTPRSPMIASCRQKTINAPPFPPKNRAKPLILDGNLRIRKLGSPLFFCPLPQKIFWRPISQSTWLLPTFYCGCLYEKNTEISFTPSQGISWNTHYEMIWIFCPLFEQNFVQTKADIICLSP